MKFTPLLTASCAALAFTAPLHAQSDTAGRVVAETLFAALDQSGRGAIHMGDLEVFRASVYAGMNTDGAGGVTYAEFADWDPGFLSVAQDADRVEAYSIASRIVFAFWDRNGNGTLTEPEMRIAMTSDFRRADLDDNAVLDETEFIQNFPMMIAMRTALRPDL